MESWISMTVAIFAAVMASSGFWTYIHSRTGKLSATNQLLLGLAHERIVHVGAKYVQRGWITYDEYEDFIKYLYTPYCSFGGNGMVDKIKDEVSKLPLKSGRQNALEVHFEHSAPKQRNV